MSDLNFRAQFDGFYYHSPRQEGLQVTAMTPQIPEALRTHLNNFMCRISFAGDKKEERIVWCPPLGGFCKLFISRDALYARDYFYHSVTIGEKLFMSSWTADEDPFVNRICALLYEKSTANSSNVPAKLPAESKVLPVVQTDNLLALYKNNPAQMQKLVFLAFKPVLSLGQQVSTFRFPVATGEACTTDKSLVTAALVLSLLPKELFERVHMRFSADSENLSSLFGCNYSFLCGNTAADFDSETVSALTPAEDPTGIFSALGSFICTYGLAAYRKHILPILSCWVSACLQKGVLSMDFLYLLLSGIAELKLAKKNINTDVLAQFFIETDAKWYETCAPVLLSTIRNLPLTGAIRKAMQANALYARTADKLPADGMDPFFLLFAGLASSAAYEEKESIVTSLYDRFKDSQTGLSLLKKIKDGMNLLLQLPAKPTPENIFKGVRSLEKGNPRYAVPAAGAAIDGYIAHKDESWINCLYSILSENDGNAQLRQLMNERCEDLLKAAEDRKTIAWVCTTCAPRLKSDIVFKPTFIYILSRKMISYDEFLRCIRAGGLSEADLPGEPAPKEPAKSVDSLEALAKVTIPKKEDELSAVQAGMLNRLCELLEKDCTWQDFRKYIPVILKNAGFRPTMRVQPKLETLLLRQLTVLATDIPNMQGGQKAYVELLVSLRKDFCLCLYPATGAAAGKFDSKKNLAASLKKVVLQVLPWIVQALVVMMSAYFLFVFLRPFPAASVLHTALPVAACCVGAVLIVLQTAVLRRLATKDYLLPAGVILFAAGLLQLII